MKPLTRHPDVEESRTEVDKAGVSKAAVGKAGLDIVVPFTTSSLTQLALDAADRMGAGLDASIRLIRVQVVPYPLDLAQTPVACDFIRGELSLLHSELPLSEEIRLARDSAEGLKGALRKGSVVVVAYHRRVWITPQERLAASLRRAGYQVVLLPVVRSREEVAGRNQYA